MEKKIRKERVFAVVLILAFIYAVYLVAKLVQNPTNTFMVTNGKISQEESDIGYIIREETVVKGQNYKNGMVKIKNEGEKVAKGDSVFRYYSSGEEELKNKIAELDVEIQSLMQNEKSSFPSDVKLLESQIEKELDSIYGVNNAQKIQEYKKNINSYITKKAKISSPSNSRLKELLSQREEYENRLTSDSENVNAPESGIVSYRVDGLESVLTTENFTKFNKSFLQDLKLKTGQTVASNEEVGKIINNYQCYIVFNSNTNEAKNSKVGDTIKIRVQNSDTLKASVENIIDEDLKNREDTIIALLLDANQKIFQKIKEKIKPQDFKDETNRKIAEKLYEELEKQDTNVNKLIDEFDEQTQNHITKVMATDYEIENIDKAVDDILLKYERERLESQKKDILKKLENEQDGETKKELSKELSNIIIALAKIK